MFIVEHVMTSHNSSTAYKVSDKYYENYQRIFGQGNATDTKRGGKLEPVHQGGNVAESKKDDGGKH